MRFGIHLTFLHFLGGFFFGLFRRLVSRLGFGPTESGTGMKDVRVCAVYYLLFTVIFIRSEGGFERVSKIFRYLI